MTAEYSPNSWQQLTRASWRPVLRCSRAAMTSTWRSEKMSGGGPSANDSARIPSDLARAYLDNREGLTTLNQAIQAADQESILRLNRGAIARDYQRQAGSLDRLHQVTTGAEPMPDDDTEFNVDSPTTTSTTINNAGVPAWVPLLTAAAMGLAGAGGAAALLATRQPSPPAVAPNSPATVDTDTDTQYRVVLE